MAALGGAVQECGERLLHRRHEPLLQASDIVFVRVPGHTRAVAGGDEFGAVLYQASGEKVRLAPRVPAVALANAVWLFRKIESTRGVSGRHYPRRLAAL